MFTSSHGRVTLLTLSKEEKTGTGILTENKDGIMCFVVASLMQFCGPVFSNESSAWIEKYTDQ